MTETSHGSLRRWLVPVVALVAVAAVSLAGGRLAVADSDLAPRTAAELLADLQRARLDQLSGTVVQTADLGLPSIPVGPGRRGGAARTDLADAGIEQMLTLASGTHTWRLWYGGEDRQRLALITSLGESDIIHNGRDLWVWSSRSNSATHYLLPEQAATRKPGGKEPSELPELSELPESSPGEVSMPRTPEEAAQLALAAIDPTTRADVGPAVVVAGRTAYELVLTPKDDATLVDSVRIAVDGERHLPLRVQVFSTRMSTPAIEIGFTAIDFSAPEARQFEFTPPPGVTVSEGNGYDMDGHVGRTPHPNKHLDKADAARDRAEAVRGSEGLRTVGAGWSRVAVASGPPLAELESGSGDPGDPGDDGPAAADPMRLLQSLPRVSGDWGTGYLLEGTLFTVLLTDSGQVAIGAVGPDALYAALATS